MGCAYDLVSCGSKFYSEIISMAVRKKKVLVITGTRAEWGLFQSTVLLLKKSSNIDLRVLVTGMHTQRRFGYTLNEVKKTVNVHHVVPVGEHDDQLTALSKELDGIGRYLKKHPADAILVIGDRDEPFAASIAALHLGISIIHIAGGDVSGPTVDHYQRNAMTIFSRLHLVQTARSKKNVLALGADTRWTKVVGAPGLDQLRPASLPRRKKLADAHGLDMQQQWFLISMHPTVLDTAPIPQQINSVLSALKKLDAKAEKIILYPNSDEGNEQFITAIEKLKGKKHYHLKRHLIRSEYLGFMKECDALIGNTSSGLMEAGYLKSSFVHVGNRQKGREHGENLIFVDYDEAAISRGIRKAVSPKFQKMLAKSTSVYQGGAVAKRIVKEIENFLLTL